MHCQNDSVPAPADLVLPVRSMIPPKIPDESPMSLLFHSPDRNHDQLEGLRVLVLGLGRHGGGTDLIRFLVSRGAKVSVSENAPEKQLAASLAKLEGIDLHRKTFDRHKSEDLDDCDWVVVNPAIPPSSPFLEEIASSDTRAVTEMGLALSWLPSKHLAAITGTNGKSTTCVLAGDMLRASGKSVSVGGNLGGSLLGDLDRPDPERRYIIEISSFQAERLEPDGIRPRIVSVTNLSPDHLDWHGDESRYFAAKQRLLEPSQDEEALAILGTSDPFGVGFSCPHRRVIRCGNEGESRQEDGVLSVMSPDGEKISIPYRPSLALEGDAGIENVLHAATISIHLGATAEGISQAIHDFKGLPHRYQDLGEIRGIRFIDDSKATSPESASAALARSDAPVHWLCGGQSKGLDLVALANVARKRDLHAYCFGAVQKELYEALQRGEIADDRLHQHAELETALAAALNCADTGDVVLLSPAFASFDQYSCFEDRGIHFQQLVENCRQTRNVL